MGRQRGLIQPPGPLSCVSVCSQDTGTTSRQRAPGGGGGRVDSHGGARASQGFSLSTGPSDVPELRHTLSQEIPGHQGAKREGRWSWPGRLWAQNHDGPVIFLQDRRSQDEVLRIPPPLHPPSIQKTFTEGPLCACAVQIRDRVRTTQTSLSRPPASPTPVPTHPLLPRKIPLWGDGGIRRRSRGAVGFRGVSLQRPSGPLPPCGKSENLWFSYQDEGQWAPGQARLLEQPSCRGRGRKRFL